MSDFFDSIRQNPDYFGVWEEMDKTTMVRIIESTYNEEVIREHQISDLVINNSSVLVKWRKRYKPLTDEELIKKYGSV